MFLIPQQTHMHMRVYYALYIMHVYMCGCMHIQYICQKWICVCILCVCITGVWICMCVFACVNKPYIEPLSTHTYCWSECYWFNKSKHGRQAIICKAENKSIVAFLRCLTKQCNLCSIHVVLMMTMIAMTTMMVTMILMMVKTRVVNATLKK